jgi:hypothetical protein
LRTAISLIAGFLFILTEPSLRLAQWLLYGYVVSRPLQFAAYFTARTHDTRGRFGPWRVTPEGLSASRAAIALRDLAILWFAHDRLVGHS